VQLLVTEALLTVRAAYGLAQATPPAALSLALDRCVPVLRFFCHGDGALALFNGGQEESATRIGRVLDVAGGGSKIPQGAPHSGFQRLERGKSIVLIERRAQRACAARPLPTRRGCPRGHAQP
jgi:uncharacterized heparinase superfamily protein